MLCISQINICISQVDEGWLYDDVAGRQFWGSVGSGILFVRHHPEYGVQLLVVLRGEGTDESGTWGTLGGAVRSGEDSFGSALREANEEVGDLPSFREITKWVYESSGSFRYTNYVLECLDLEWVPTAFNWEVDSAEWVSLEEAGQLPLHFGLEALLGAVGEKIVGIGRGENLNSDKTEMGEINSTKTQLDGSWTEYDDESKPVLVRDDNRTGLIQ